MEVERYKQHKVIRYIKRKIFYHKSLVEKNKACRILVVLHLFYEKSWIEINEYLKNLSPYCFDLIITVTKDRISQETIHSIKKLYPSVQIRVAENKGYDLLPFLCVIENVDLGKYDIVFKLHSKSTKRNYIYIYKQLFLRRDWFVNLYEGILSAKNVHKTIDILYNQQEPGLVAAKNLIIQDPKHKVNMIQEIAESRNLTFRRDYFFVAGTCFAVKSECLKPIQSLHFEKNEFAPMVPSRGMSFAHFVERYICISVLLQGYSMKGNSANSVRRFLLQPITLLMNRMSSERLLHEDIFLDDKWFYWQMENRLIIYKFIQMKFRDMKCSYRNQVISLADGAPYKYISEGDTAGYEAYCKYHAANGLPLMTKERFDHLIKAIEETGYDERNVILINSQNGLLDGQHRACVLANKYGLDSNVRVLKIWEFREMKYLLKKRIKKLVNALRAH